MAPKLRVLLATLLCTVTTDQLTKMWVAANVTVHSLTESIPIIDGFFYITHARNPGAAFGLMLDWSLGVRLVVFITVFLVAVAVVISFYRGLAPGDRFSAVALGLILGGATGNLCDRIIHGEVIDFLHFRLWGDVSWPDFNLADTFIVLGVTTLMLELLASEGAARASQREVGSERAARKKE